MRQPAGVPLRSASITAEMHNPITGQRKGKPTKLRLSAAILLMGFARVATAQISLSSAVDIAVRSHPKVRSAEAEVERAQAALKETHDIFIPSVTAGAGLGQAYGYSTNPPTLFSFSAGSLVYSSAQFSY